MLPVSYLTALKKCVPNLKIPFVSSYLTPWSIVHTVLTISDYCFVLLCFRFWFFSSFFFFFLLLVGLFLFLFFLGGGGFCLFFCFCYFGFFFVLFSLKLMSLNQLNSKKNIYDTVHDPSILR